MKYFLEEYGTLIAEFIVGLALVAVLIAFTTSENGYKDSIPELKNASAGNNMELASEIKPTLTVKNVTIKAGETLKPMDYVTAAKDADGKDLTSKVVVKGLSKIDTTKEGIYSLTYVVQDDKGLVCKALSIITIKADAPEST